MGLGVQVKKFHRQTGNLVITILFKIRIYTKTQITVRTINDVLGDISIYKIYLPSVQRCGGSAVQVHRLALAGNLAQPKNAS